MNQVSGIVREVLSDGIAATGLAGTADPASATTIATAGKPWLYAARPTITPGTLTGVEVAIPIHVVLPRPAGADADEAALDAVTVLVDRWSTPAQPRDLKIGPATWPTYLLTPTAIT